jgi:hypothetical protein
MKAVVKEMLASKTLIHLFSVMRKYRKDEDIQRMAMRACSFLTFDSDAIKNHIAAIGGIDTLVSSLDVFLHDRKILEETLLLLRNLACFDKNKEVSSTHPHSLDMMRVVLCARIRNGQDKTRQGKTRQDETRRDETGRDETRRDKTRRDETRRDETKRDKTRQDKTSQDRTP